MNDYQEKREEIVQARRAIQKKLRIAHEALAEAQELCQMNLQWGETQKEIKGVINSLDEIERSIPDPTPEIRG